MSTKKFKGLIQIDLSELTGKEIGEIKKEESFYNKYYNTIIPEYCLHIDNGSIRSTKDYLQWVENGDEKYYLFNIITSDDLIHEEVSNSGGYEALFGEIDLRPCFKHLEISKINRLFYRGLESGQYIIGELTYIGGDQWNPDFDLEFNIIGVITKDIKIIEI